MHVSIYPCRPRCVSVNMYCVHDGQTLSYVIGPSEVSLERSTCYSIQESFVSSLIHFTYTVPFKLSASITDSLCKLSSLPRPRVCRYQSELKQYSHAFTLDQSNHGVVFQSIQAGAEGGRVREDCGGGKMG